VTRLSANALAVVAAAFSPALRTLHRVFAVGGGGGVTAAAGVGVGDVP
jgi:hypothetical protein